MAKDRGTNQDYVRPIRRILTVGLVIILFGIFLVWRIDNPRVERLRANLVDQIIPSFEWALVPVTKAAGMIENFQS